MLPVRGMPGVEGVEGVAFSFFLLLRTGSLGEFTATSEYKNTSKVRQKQIRTCII